MGMDRGIAIAIATTAMIIVMVMMVLRMIVVVIIRMMKRFRQSRHNGSSPALVSRL